MGLRYRKNKDPGKSDARIKAQPLSALARSANMFIHTDIELVSLPKKTDKAILAQ
ncbi:MAG: hypothetical protein KJO08_02740 [Gammaproteobacteria bacterium]|nr:hypothetical protein [Gammaproteobacteria bacterium]NNJ85250.1 hypothetical protein [Gammaproteobacteria bacterium]